jgi:hypothetical protein
MWRFIGGSISPQIAVNASWAYAKGTFEIPPFFLDDFQIKQFGSQSRFTEFWTPFLCG